MGKKLKVVFKYSSSSLFHQMRWIRSIEITGFNSRREEDNKILFNEICDAVSKYNRKGDELLKPVTVCAYRKGRSIVMKHRRTKPKRR